MKKICKIALCVILAITVAGCSTQNSFENTTWTSSGDKSNLQFINENEWIWYLDKNVTDDNFYSGTYDIHYGKEAIDYLEKDGQISSTQVETFYEYIEFDDQYDITDFLVITLLHESIVIDGNESHDEQISMYYFGFILEEDTVLEITNMTTGSTYTFTKD